MKTQILVTLAGFFIWGFAHAAVTTCAADSAGQALATRVVKIGNVTTYFEPGVCLGLNESARIYVDQEYPTDGTAACMAFGLKDVGGTVGDFTSSPYGGYGVSLDESGQVTQISSICTAATCPKIIRTLSCRVSPQPTDTKK